VNIWTICLNTFKESVRDRIFYLLLMFAIFIILVSRAISWIGLDEVKIMKDFGLSTISFFAVIVAIYVGTGLLFKEIDRRTIYTVLSKPVRRYEFLLGKYFGLLLMLLVNVAVMGATFVAYLYLWQGYAGIALLKGIFLIYLELVLLTAVAIMFSTLASPILSAVFTLCVYITGHFMDGFRMLSERAERAGSVVGKLICDVAFYILPNLGFFDAKREAVHGKLISAQRIGLCIGYCAVYTIILLTVSLMVFRRKNF